MDFTQTVGPGQIACGDMQGNCKVVRSSGFSRLSAHNFRLKAGLRTTGGLVGRCFQEDPARR
jgi:hypothetical protein